MNPPSQLMRQRRQDSYSFGWRWKWGSKGIAYIGDGPSAHLSVGGFRFSFSKPGYQVAVPAGSEPHVRVDLQVKLLPRPQALCEVAGAAGPGRLVPVQPHLANVFSPGLVLQQCHVGSCFARLSLQEAKPGP